jgi:hypothetical protein
MTRHAATLLVAIGLALGAAGCDIDQTREGELPEVEVREGQMPAYDVDTADVDFDTTTETVDVPDVDVTTREETVEVPNVDVDMPGEDDDYESPPTE